MAAPKVPPKYDQRTFTNILGDMQGQIDKVSARIGTYTVQNFTETRTLDMATATSTEIGNFLATLVSDLKNGGRLG